LHHLFFGLLELTPGAHQTEVCRFQVSILWVVLTGTL
jgi:hypothetical protein